MTVEHRVPFQPEAHDIGKLLHLEGTELGSIIKANNHVFLAPDGNPLDFYKHGLTPPTSDNLTWLAALLHHPPRPGEYRLEAEECADLGKPSALSFETRSSIFLMMISDHLAAATSRTIAGKIKAGIKPSAPQIRDGSQTDHPRELIRLWNRSRKVSWQAGVLTKSMLQEKLLDYLRFDASKDPFLRRFEQDLSSLPEDKFPLMNLTSLYTHCELVGKIYRVLDGHVQRFPGTLEMSLDGIKVKTVSDAEQRWQLTLVRSEVVSPHQPVRVGDLNVTRLRNEILESLRTNPDTKNHILLQTADTMWFLFPGKDQEQIASRLSYHLEPLCEVGLYAENLLFSSPIHQIQNIDPAVMLGRKAGELSRAQEDLRKIERVGGDSKTLGRTRGRYMAISSELSGIFAITYSESVISKRGEEIDPPLCEICQMNPGEEILHAEMDRQVTDYLCGGCLSIRKSGERFGKLASWGEGNSRAAWIKVLLDKRLMEEVIQELYFKHAQDTFKESPEAVKEIQENFRNLGLLSDFAKDYFSFVTHFASKIFEQFGGERDKSESGFTNVELLDNEYLEFFVLRVEEDVVVPKILQIFVNLLRSPVGFPDCADKSPIKLRVSISRPKYPFFEHWDFLRDESGFIKVQVPSKSSLELTLEEYDRLADCGLEKGVGRSFLHRLVEIEVLSCSPLLVRAELAPGPRDPRVQRDFKERLRRLDATGALPLSKVLSYAKLLEL